MAYLGKKFKRLNARRIELILKDLDGGLTPEEKVEHDTISEWCSAEINRVFPYDYSKLEELEQEVRRLQKSGRRIRKWLDKLEIK